MGKTWRHLWREIGSFENLYTAYGKTARGKRSTRAVEGFAWRLEENLVELQTY